MKRSTALDLFGGTVASAARRLNVTTQAVHKWPQTGSMTRAVCDHCLAEWVRQMAELPAMRLAFKRLKLPPDALLTPENTPKPVQRKARTKVNEVKHEEQATA